MVFPAVADRSMRSAQGETPLITGCPAARAGTCQKWEDGAVIWPVGAGALVEIKVVPASKPGGMRAVAADLAALATVDCLATLGLPGPDAGTDERWWQDLYQITELWAVCIAMMHGPAPIENPRPECRLS